MEGMKKIKQSIPLVRSDRTTAGNMSQLQEVRQDHWAEMQSPGADPPPFSLAEAGEGPLPLPISEDEEPEVQRNAQGRQQPCRGHTFSSPPAQAGAGRGQPTAHPRHPPRLLFAVAGGRGMLPVPEGLRLPLWCWGGCPEPRCAPGEGLGWKGGRLKPLPAPGGAPGHRWDQAVEPGAFGRPLPSLGGGQRARKRLLPVREAPTGNASLPPPPRGRTGEGKQQNGAKPPQNIPAAARPGGSRPAGRGPRI